MAAAAAVPRSVINSWDILVFIHDGGGGGNETRNAINTTQFDEKHCLGFVSRVFKTQHY